MRRLIPSDPGTVARALAIGAVGGAVFAWFNMPLAWMMGAMCLVTVSTLAGVEVRVPPLLRSSMVAVLGVMLGSAFRPEMLSQMGRWSVSLMALAVYLVVIAVVVGWYFRHIARYDRATAYFSAVPGGLTEMILVGGAMGGDDRTIALSHASRILLVVLIVPFWFRLVGHYEPTQIGAAFDSFSDIPPLDLAVLAASGVIGFVGARAARLPAAMLTGPMIVSAIAHLTGVTDSNPPRELIIVAQLVVGTAIGCRFAGVPLARVVRAIAAAAGSTFLMLLIGVAFAMMLNAALGLPVFALVLAYAPGGLAEMSLIALALGVDPAFVSTHHVVRIFIVVIIAPYVYRRLFARPRLGD